MSDAQFEVLMRAAYLQTFPAQLDLIREGDRPTSCSWLSKAVWSSTPAATGGKPPWDIANPVSTSILAAVLRDAVYLMSARTLERSKLLLILSRDVVNVFQEDGAFVRAIVVELAGRYRGVVKQHKDLKLRTAVERLANRLLRYHRDQGAAGVLELRLEKRTLASMLGMTPENLSRAFNTLKPYGVEVDGATIRLTDLEALQVLAKPNPLIDESDT
jgi:CRP/FNR family transcriptional activator FtrB